METKLKKMKIKRVKNRPGSNIRRALALFGIRDNSGCGCTALANKMDRVGSVVVRQKVDAYTDEMCESIKKWRKERRFTVVPPANKSVVKNLILWAAVD